METTLLDWVPPDIKQEAEALTAREALNALGSWPAELEPARE
jgi:hypothetical protein